MISFFMHGISPCCRGYSRDAAFQSHQVARLALECVYDCRRDTPSHLERHFDRFVSVNRLCSSWWIREEGPYERCSIRLERRIEKRLMSAGFSLV